MKTPEEIANEIAIEVQKSLQWVFFDEIDRKTLDHAADYVKSLIDRKVTAAIQAERDRAQVLVDVIEKEIKRCGTWKEGKEALAEYSKAIIKPSEN